MELAITRMSANGQIVIPAEVRKIIGAKASTKFMVMNEGKDLYLKQMDEQRMKEELTFMKRLKRAENDVKNGRVTVVDTKMSFKEFDDIMMGRKKSPIKK
ncbi:hypothetical protein JW826_02610 [Candidatus Woesearchaeota archaeon]|nr:hypothetical protein [Candidatus Woesearchaeota archaeon]